MDKQKILVLRLSAVGDILRTLPAVKALKERFPYSSIAWITEEPAEALLKSQPEIDRVILFPRRRWSGGIKSPKGFWGTIREVVRFVGELRKEGYEVCLDFHGSLKSGLLAFLSGASRRVGYDRKSVKEGNFLFSNVKVTLSKEKINRYQRNATLLKGIGMEVNEIRPSLHIPREDLEYVDEFFRGSTGELKRPLIAIHPGTSPKTTYKRWMADRYAHLADRLTEEAGGTVIFTWGPGEKDWVEGIRKQMEAPSILAPETFSLTQLAEIFRRSDLYIGGDTGPTHIASSVGTPSVVIYGPTDPVVNEPYGRHRKVRKAVGCNPCRKRSCKELRCLKAVKVEDVFRAAREMLGVKEQ
mgnify:CR=1 FL=1